MQWRHNDCASRGLKWTCGRCTRLRYRGSKRARYRLVERSNRHWLPAMSFSAFISVPNGGLEFAQPHAPAFQHRGGSGFRAAVAGARGRGGERGENRRRRSGRMRRDPPRSGRAGRRPWAGPRDRGPTAARHDASGHAGAGPPHGPRPRRRRPQQWPVHRGAAKGRTNAELAPSFTNRTPTPTRRPAPHLSSTRPTGDTDTRHTHTAQAHTSRPAAHLTQNMPMNAHVMH